MMSFCQGQDQEKRSCQAPCPVDGGWGSYSGWTSCVVPDRNCGDGGERWQERSCVNPIPRFGGIPCVGNGTVHEACNADCATSKDIRLHGLWGTDGAREECQNGHYVTAFKTKIAINQGLTGVRLRCNDPEGQEISSLEHENGSYGDFIHSCPGGYTQGKGMFQPSAGNDQVDRDCTCIEMYCSETDQWQKSICEEGTFQIKDKGPLSCESGQVICGIKTKVWLDGGDSSGVGSVLLRCCIKP
ncbi:hemicentin-1-like [Tigriopus californicus]|uniref:hemicentin-1-like n=1 Tax=Tigriopus californicus TaxID=6832 RepID=UPI0027DA205E|nr:hemicentin-1-like [Tigriopus californicus]